jgi:signal transduction histidine kinase
MNEKNNALENTIAATTRMVIHELQAHLQGMLSKAEILADSVRAGKLERKEVQGQLDELIGMIRITNLSLTNFAMQWRPEKEDQKVDLDKIARDTIELFGPLAKQKRLSILYSNQTKTPPVVRGSVRQIQQALFNLMQNAITYSYRPSETAITNKVELTLNEEESNRYVLRISNVGPVLEPEQIDQLFEKGFRGKAEMRERSSGTGLGLWIARTIAREYGGDLSLQSKIVKAGSSVVTVSMSFPAKSEDPTSQ